MSKKYKHVPSGIEAKEYIADSQVSYQTTKGEWLPSWIVQGSDWEEVKPAYMFTTDDGVNIHIGDFYYFVTTDFIIRYTGDNYCWGGTAILPRFYHIKNADEYVLNNKPCLSLNDVYSQLDRTSPLAKNIAEVAKKKLSQ